MELQLTESVRQSNSRNGCKLKPAVGNLLKNTHMILEFCKKIGINEKDLLEGNKNSNSEFRHMYWLLLSINGFKRREIAALNDRSISTITNGIKHINGLIDYNKEMKEIWTSVKSIKRYSR